MVTSLCLFRKYRLTVVLKCCSGRQEVCVWITHTRAFAFSYSMSPLHLVVTCKGELNMTTPETLLHEAENQSQKSLRTNKGINDLEQWLGLRMLVTLGEDHVQFPVL